MQVELNKREKTQHAESDIVFSKAIKAGKRIYYLDVKKSKNDDLYLSITESKKRMAGSTENPQVSFEKHKIFLYKEDFEDFSAGLEEVINFVKSEVETPIIARSAYYAKLNEESTTETTTDEPAKQSKGFFDKFKF